MRNVLKNRISGEKIFDVINIILLIVFTLIIFYPIYYMFIVSISDGTAILRGEVSIVPIGFDLTAYETVFANDHVPRAYFNTIFYTVTGVAVNIFMTILCAYPLAQGHFYGRKVFSLLIVFTMLFDAGLIAGYLLVFNLNLLNTIWALVLPPAISAYNMILMRSFFQQLPAGLYEAAYIDGAGEFKILFKIMLPLSKPVIATLVLFYAVSHWNSYIGPLIYLDDRNMYPLQLILRNIVINNEMSTMINAATDVASSSIRVSFKYATIFVTIAPILAVYPFIQKYFTKGVMLGSLKG